MFWPFISAKQRWVTYKLEATSDGGLDVGAAEGGDLAKLPGDLDGVMEEEAQAALVTETRRVGHLSEQNCRTDGKGGRMNGQNEEILLRVWALFSCCDVILQDEIDI